MFAGFYFWWPKMTGRMLDERLGKIHFWLLFIGFHTTFLVQHWLGVEGMPRRYADYLPERRLHHAQPGLDGRRVPARRLDAAVPLQRLQVRARRRWSNVDDPWGWGRSLEWATSCPPPRHNFVTHPADPLRVPGLRPAPPGDRRARARGERGRARRRRTGRRARHGGPRGACCATATADPERTTTDEGRGLDLRRSARSSSCWSRPAYWFITDDRDRHLRAGDDDPAGRAGDASTSASTPSRWTRGPRTARTARSPTAPASWASSRRTPGGRCGARWRWPCACSACVFGWWLFIIGVGARRARAVRLDLRVLPRRARALSAALADGVSRRAEIGACVGDRGYAGDRSRTLVSRGSPHVRPEYLVSHCTSAVALVAAGGARA